MKAIILAAGQGTRLAPLTDDKPKCLVSLFGRPLLLQQLETLRSTGIDDITIIAGYRHEQITAAAPDCRILVNHDYAATNMVNTLFRDSDAMENGRDDLLICYSDILYEPRVLAAMSARNAPVTLAVNTGWRALWQRRMENPLADAETLRLRPDGTIFELGKRASSYGQIEGQYMGIILVRADCVPEFREAYDLLDRDMLYDGQPFAKMYMTSFLQNLIDKGWRVDAAPVDGGWLEVDTIADRDLYHGMLADGSLDAFYRGK